MAVDEEARRRRIEQLRDAVTTAIKADCAERGDVPVQDLVAVLSFLTGATVAQLDQRCWSVPAAMDMVTQNFQAGNRSLIEHLRTVPAAGNA